MRSFFGILGESVGKIRKAWESLGILRGNVRLAPGLATLQLGLVLPERPQNAPKTDRQPARSGARLSRYSQTFVFVAASFFFAARPRHLTNRQDLVCWFP